MQWESPATIWSGATTTIMPIAIENMRRAPASVRSRRRCNAPTAPTTSAVVRQAVDCPDRVVRLNC
jgi:hypothetical protein